jgi:hypothetical protein
MTDGEEAAVTASDRKEAEAVGYDSRPDTYEHIGKVRLYLGRAVTRLIDRGDNHDASKLVDPELEAFDRMTPLLASLTYGTDEYKASLAELGTALEHHYAENSHHPEHYEDGIAGMSLLDLLEMVCDWYAASQRMRKPMPAAPGRKDAPAYDSDFARSIALNQERFGYSDELRAVLTNTAYELGFIADEAAA